MFNALEAWLSWEFSGTAIYQCSKLWVSLFPLFRLVQRLQAGRRELDLPRTSWLVVCPC